MTALAQVTEADEFAWLVSNFVEDVPGVVQALVVSTDGLVLTSREGSREQAEQLAAIVSGFQSLAGGTARVVGQGEPEQVIMQLGRGRLFITPVSDGSVLAALTSAEAEGKIVGHQVARLVENAGHVLIPQLRG
ncbi:roadblock/LC7 domain-containing protein [Allosalinactinospora lopnorensis]|uniref:roadblock/LC7 domain-containing protein n=1 Tax=Allosalinactinospora lopnorensis TaxID=1352348 RepID=UPI000623E4DF|nr:roadblock/LC7 domain-containing protein [Allosalinactinospora lopnorensis]